MADLRPILVGMILMAGCPAAAEESATATSVLWNEYVSACNHPRFEIVGALAASGWSPHEPAADSYVGQLLTSTERALQVTRNAGELPHDFKAEMDIQVFAKSSGGQDIFLMLIDGPIPDGSGRTLVDCSLIAPDFNGRFSRGEMTDLGGSVPQDQSNTLMVKFGWQPGLAANQLKTEIAFILPAGEQAMRRAGLVAQGLTIKSQTLEGPTQ